MIEPILKVVNLVKRFGVLMATDSLNFEVVPGEIHAVIGPNGAGKTTLFKMIMGLEQPGEGKLRVGDTVVPSYVDQSRESLDGEKTVYEEISGGHDYLIVGHTRIHSRSHGYADTDTHAYAHADAHTHADAYTDTPTRLRGAFLGLEPSRLLRDAEPVAPGNQRFDFGDERGNAGL